VGQVKVNVEGQYMEKYKRDFSSESENETATLDCTTWKIENILVLC